MKLYSTNNKEYQVDLKKAVLNSLAPDKGLYMPMSIPTLEKSFIENLKDYTLPEIGFHVCSRLFDDAIPSNDLMSILNKALSFPAPVVNIDKGISTLELFHGPSLAFKDFGARFMAQLMEYYNEGENQKLTILVATSGDTGGAVAAGFYKTPGTEVIILYPKGKVSDIQEKQLTSLGENIHACEIDGTFDDCQALVKTAFLDKELNKSYRLSSANSINIARLIPQSFYYYEAFKQVDSEKIVFCVPSGNFGNLTAGLIAKKMGLPIHQFIAATNENHIVPDYLKTGIYKPATSISTVSNAMDVGNPSNFVRMAALYDHNIESIQSDIKGYWYKDAQVKKAIYDVYTKKKYTLDPHGAIGYLASLDYLKSNPGAHVIFHETAHPCKFIDTVEESTGTKTFIPDAIQELIKKEKNAVGLSKGFEEFKDYLLGRV